ncbi:MAG: GDSL-type esterase/lipase family protein [Acidobacteriota bacterium]|nr:GDSL-type esterase/lipase family protein [Acidobacteriota bacterium]
MFKQIPIYLLLLSVTFPPIGLQTHFSRFAPVGGFVVSADSISQINEQTALPARTQSAENPQDRKLTIANTSSYSTASAAKPRRNIGRVLGKLQRGGPVTVAFLGGSVALGNGASNAEKTSYRSLVTNWLRQRFPKAEISEINAGLTTTGSLYGAMRVRRDVLAQKADLVFVEFAANEANDEERPVKKAIEGLLRQFLIVPSPPEVVMIYAPNAKKTSRAEWHDQIAAHYQVPAINLLETIQPLIEAGKFNFAKDGVNPTDAGHKLYADAITAFLAEQEKLESSPILRTLPSPLVSDEMNYGEFKAFAEIRPPKGHETNWKTEPSNDRALPSALLASDKTNAQIEFYFEGTVVGITFRASSDAGMIECLIDGKPATAPAGKVDAYSSTPQLGTKIFGGLSPGEHRLTVRVTGEKNAKSSGAHVRLGYLIVGGQRPERL